MITRAIYFCWKYPDSPTKRFFYGMRFTSSKGRWRSIGVNLPMSKKYLEDEYHNNNLWLDKFLLCYEIC